MPRFKPGTLVRFGIYIALVCQKQGTAPSKIRIDFGDGTSMSVFKHQISLDIEGAMYTFMC
mgnify:FL=1|tara:strand:+ start:336 stop:518 length:183 start_codon:yes stop_codon:yes gene_type:complete